MNYKVKQNMATIASEYSSEASNTPIEHQFNPYGDNGGTILGIAGEDFAVLAGDTRNITDYSINSRYEPKVFDCGDNIVMSANGFAADGDALVKRFKNSVKWYHFDHNDKKLSINSAARNIQHLLYGKRFSLTTFIRSLRVLTKMVRALSIRSTQLAPTKENSVEQVVLRHH